MSNWNITVWGVRGSSPVPSPDCMEYGGNTACISVERKEQLILLDAGSGLARLSQALEKHGSLRRADLLLSHLHLDHLQGLFFFEPLYQPGCEIHLYGCPDFARQLQLLFGPPFWPLKLENLASEIHFHEICPGDTFFIGDLIVRTAAGNHPGGSLLYRLEADGRSLVYGLDCECSDSMREPLKEFAAGTDLLIWDSTFAPEDLRPGWGHSTWEQGLAVGQAAGAHRLLMTHFHTDYTDQMLHRQEALAQSRGQCIFAKEGMKLEL